MSRNLESRLIKLEKASESKDQIYVVYVDPPEGVVIDNVTVFKSQADIPTNYRKKHGDFAVFKRFSPDWV